MIQELLQLSPAVQVALVVIGVLVTGALLLR